MWTCLEQLGAGAAETVDVSRVVAGWADDARGVVAAGATETASALDAGATEEESSTVADEEVEAAAATATSALDVTAADEEATTEDAAVDEDPEVEAVPSALRHAKLILVTFVEVKPQPTTPFRSHSWLTYGQQIRPSVMVTKSPDTVTSLVTRGSPTRVPSLETSW